MSRLFLALACLGICGCARHPDATALLPASDEAPGWTRLSEPHTFDAGSLAKHIDGGAEKYLQAGFRAAATAEYKFNNRWDAAADVYVMNGSEAARKIFDSESGAGSRTANLGEASRLYGASLVYRKGPHLVRITAYEEAPGTAPALLELGRAIERKLK